MANWLDFVGLLTFIGVFGGIIYAAIELNKQFSGAVASTKDGLKKRGLDITETGVSVKTDKRLDRSDYLAATQRKLVNALGAASYGSPDNQKAVPEVGSGYAAPGTRHRESMSKK